MKKYFKVWIISTLLLSFLCFTQEDFNLNRIFTEGFLSIFVVVIYDFLDKEGFFENEKGDK